MANTFAGFSFVSFDAIGIRGGCPPTIQQQIAGVQRPGVDGTGFIRLGIKGMAFQARSFVDVSTFAAACTVGLSYQTLARDQAYEMEWCGQSFDEVNTRFFVIGVEPPVIQRCSASVGGLVVNSQATVEAIWTLVPVYYEAP